MPTKRWRRGSGSDTAKLVARRPASGIIQIDVRIVGERFKKVSYECCRCPRPSTELVWRGQPYVRKRSQPKAEGCTVLLPRSKAPVTPRRSADIGRAKASDKDRRGAGRGRNRGRRAHGEGWPPRRANVRPVFPADPPAIGSNAARPWRRRGAHEACRDAEQVSDADEVGGGAVPVPRFGPRRWKQHRACETAGASAPNPAAATTGAHCDAPSPPLHWSSGSTNKRLLLLKKGNAYRDAMERRQYRESSARWERQAAHHGRMDRPAFRHFMNNKQRDVA